MAKKAAEVFDQLQLHILNFICPKFRKLQLQKFMIAVINEKNQQQLFKELPLRNNEK